MCKEVYNKDKEVSICVNLIREIDHKVYFHEIDYRSHLNIFNYFLS